MMSSRLTNIPPVAAFAIPLLAALAIASCGHDSPVELGNPVGLRLTYLSDNAQIHVIGLDGTHDTTITPNDEQVIWYFGHPDTQRIAYYTIDRNLHILDRKSGTNIVVTSVPHPQWISWLDWSPDGNRLAVMDSGVVILVDAAGNNPVTLASDVSNPSLGTAMWTRDGQYIVAGGSLTQVIPVSGGTTHRISTPYAIAYPAPSPNGATVAFSMAAGIWTVPAVGGGPNEILTPGNADNFQSSQWSPDGKSLVGTNDNATIWIANADGSNFHQYPAAFPFGLFNSLPQWSPDGTLVAFVAGTNASFDIATMHPDGSGLTTVTHIGRVSMPHWMR
jgi:Tol biopolymer transport system component